MTETPLEAALTVFLAGEARICFPEPDTPEGTVVMVLFQQAAKTLAALKALAASDFRSFRLILVDNASTDSTAELLSRIDGARIHRNRENVHFLRANNQVLPELAGDFVLFLNNDAVVAPEAVGLAAARLREQPDCGAVGGTLIYPDGRLQEAGCIIWREGACQGVGRGDDPEKARYAFCREVDFCSGAFLMTRTRLFREAGGFDPRYAPAYYEEVDYCVWLQQEGYAVVYDPAVRVVHHEFGSSGKAAAVQWMQQHQARFLEKHEEWLSGQLVQESGDVEAARFARRARARPRVLYLDEQIPHRDEGAGYPRGNAIVNGFAALGATVSVYALRCPDLRKRQAGERRDLHPAVEILDLQTAAGLMEHLRAHPELYDLIWVSRPNVFAAVAEDLAALRGRAVLVYDAEAVFSERARLKEVFFGPSSAGESGAAQALAEEMALAGRADAVVTVTDADAAKFQAYGCRKTLVLSHLQEVDLTPQPFAARRDLLFVGNLDYEDTPNTDSLCWFVRGVLPLLWLRQPGLVLHVAGPSASARVKELAGPQVVLHGKLEKLTPLYDQCRLLIAPTRYAAGIPLKIIEAAARGLPVVATDLLCGQLGWTPGKELQTAPAAAVAFARAVLTAYDHENIWQRLRENAAQQIAAGFSQAQFLGRLREILVVCGVEN